MNLWSRPASPCFGWPEICIVEDLRTDAVTTSAPPVLSNTGYKRKIEGFLHPAPLGYKVEGINTFRNRRMFAERNRELLSTSYTTGDPGI
jgi:hypothetical protein